ncbi:hypothetical protein HNQ51_001848 [Inhella inkyongensis]|uniref:Ice-binding protein C-terminal domain-containing protein n=1 Tax=Inhella inkyongensis TaxID=392593 RepID=A0A840S6X2_9BURK|nr:PEP-CTERM sorting domain-containing protein [Inhella inkyongensis]MBB5204534.1 hypothetical protein [Inhella inkyongensis]
MQGRRLFSALAAAGLMLVGGAVQALELSYGGTAGVSVTANSSTGGSNQLVSRYTAGTMTYQDRAGNSFAAFCVEPSQRFANGANGFVDFTIGSFSAATEARLEALYSTSFASTVGNSAQAAAFQLAIWEIVNEAPGQPMSLAFGSGSIYLTGTHVGNAAQNLAMTNTLRASAQSMLTAAQNYTGPNLYQVSYLSNGTFQDMVIAQAVPEPATYALMGLGLLVIGLRKRRQD